MDSSTVSTLISSMNTMFNFYGRRDLWISAKEHGLERGLKYSNVNLANSPDSQIAFNNFLARNYLEKVDIKYESLRHQIAGQDEVGMRFREAALNKSDQKGLQL